MRDPTGRVYRLAVAHARIGMAWVFSPLGMPLHQIQAPDGKGRLTNIAYLRA